jgi:hypothetical protein
MSVRPFNCKPSPATLETNGYWSFTLENVPAFHEEPYMLAEANVRPWVLLYYHSDVKRDPDKYWDSVGRDTYASLKDTLKPNNEVKRLAAEAVAGIDTPEDKVSALIRCLWKHTRGYYDSGVTDVERQKAIAKLPDRTRTSAEVLKSGFGTADERNLLFAAMASSVGLEARPVLLPNRNDIIFDRRMADDYFLDNVDMAVRIGDAWKFYDVSARLPPGMLEWTEEGLPSLLSDPKQPVFVQSPIAPPESSLVRRTAHLTLSDNGTLEGDIEESFSGHSAPERRDKLQGESEARQQEICKENVIGVFAQAEVSAIAVQNVDNPSEPLIVKYHIKVPTYATRTAKRILLQPLFFQFGAAPRFTAAERRYQISMPYAWKEHDEISVAFPPGFVLDNGENPGRISFGKTGWYDLKMSIQNKNELAIKRELVFGQEGILAFQREVYPTIKAIFDTVHGHDTVALTLRQGEASH